MFCFFFGTVILSVSTARDSQYIEMLIIRNRLFFNTWILLFSGIAWENQYAREQISPSTNTKDRVYLSCSIPCYVYCLYNNFLGVVFCSVIDGHVSNNCIRLLKFQQATCQACQVLFICLVCVITDNFDVEEKRKKTSKRNRERDLTAEEGRQKITWWRSPSY